MTKLRAKRTRPTSPVDKDGSQRLVDQNPLSGSRKFVYAKGGRGQERCNAP